MKLNMDDLTPLDDELSRQFKESAESFRAASVQTISPTVPNTSGLFRAAEEIYAAERKQKEAALDTAAALKAINEKLDAERQDRIQSEKTGTRRERMTLIVALLTLIATVAIGLITITLQIS